MRISDWSSDVCSSDLELSPEQSEDTAAAVTATAAEGGDVEKVQQEDETAQKPAFEVAAPEPQPDSNTHAAAETAPQEEEITHTSEEPEALEAVQESEDESETDEINSSQEVVVSTDVNPPISCVATAFTASALPEHDTE